MLSSSFYKHGDRGQFGGYIRQQRGCSGRVGASGGMSAVIAAGCTCAPTAGGLRPRLRRGQRRPSCCYLGCTGAVAAAILLSRPRGIQRRQR
jgi:hypothetical protein